MNGRKKDVLFEDAKYKDSTGVEFISDVDFFVWADKGVKAEIKSVEGVSNVVDVFETYYHVYIDHRYETEYVKREIESAILCRKDGG